MVRLGGIELGPPEDIRVQQYCLSHLTRQALTDCAFPGAACTRNDQQGKLPKRMRKAAFRTDRKRTCRIDDLVGMIHTALKTNIHHSESNPDELTGAKQEICPRKYNPR